MNLLPTMMFLILFLPYFLQLQVYALASNNDCSGSSEINDKIDRELGTKLSSKASIVHYTSAAPRWSDYHAPKPGTIVNVADENDVVETVKYCIKNNLDFLAQSGGHGWSTTFHIGEKDVIINMRGLNQVTVSASKDNITIGGGTLVSELVEAAYQNQVVAVTTTCNCVGMMGAILGGGFGCLMSYYGFAMDSLLSVNLVTAEGELITVSSTSYPDLWWALRGAGANFGIVTSAVLKAHPPINNNNTAWVGGLIFSSDKLEAIIQVLNDFDYQKETSALLLFATAPPDFTPTLIVSLWYAGSEAEGKAAFQALYDLGPVASTSQVVPYNKFNEAEDVFCGKGGRKPGYNVYLRKLDPKAFREVWNEYVSFVTKDPSFNLTSMLIGGHSTKEVTKFDSASPYRDIEFIAVLTQSYEDPKFDDIARQSGIKIRALLDANSGFDELHCYINESYGDESLEAIYGKSLPRLKELKKIWDKEGRFSQFFPIPHQSQERSS